MSISLNDIKTAVDNKDIILMDGVQVDLDEVTVSYLLDNIEKVEIMPASKDNQFNHNLFSVDITEAGALSVLQSLTDYGLIFEESLHVNDFSKKWINFVRGTYGDYSYNLSDVSKLPVVSTSTLKGMMKETENVFHGVYIPGYALAPWAHAFKNILKAQDIAYEYSPIYQYYALMWDEEKAEYVTKGLHTKHVYPFCGLLKISSPDLSEMIVDRLSRYLKQRLDTDFHYSGCSF